MWSVGELVLACVLCTLEYRISSNVAIVVNDWSVGELVLACVL